MSEEIAEVKKENISLPVKESIQKEGQKPGLLRQILKKAIAVLTGKIRAVVASEKPELKVDMEVFRQMQNVRRKLLNIQKSIRGIDAQIQKMQNRLNELTGLAGTFRLKEKKRVDEYYQYFNLGKNKARFFIERDSDKGWLSQC